MPEWVPESMPELDMARAAGSNASSSVSLRVVDSIHSSVFCLGMSWTMPTIGVARIKKKDGFRGSGVWPGLTASLPLALPGHFAPNQGNTDCSTAS
jgi:hypothetical protein